MSRRAKRVDLDLMDLQVEYKSSARDRFALVKNEDVLKLKQIKPINFPQKQAFESFAHGNNLFMMGSAGTGKSFVALYLALQWAKENDKRKVKIVRSAVESRAIGFLPGSLEEKIAVYQQPYKEIIDSLCGKGMWLRLESEGILEFVTTSFVRGLTWDDTCVVFDEIQDTTFHEANSVITRLGKGSRIILSGDVKQNDLQQKREQTGWKQLVAVAGRISSFDVVNFQSADIVRSGFVKEWISACEELGL